MKYCKQLILLIIVKTIDFLGEKKSKNQTTEEKKIYISLDFSLNVL